MTLLYNKETKDGTKNPPYRLAVNKHQEVALSGFGISGPVTWIVTSTAPIIFSPDWRVTV